MTLFSPEILKSKTSSGAWRVLTGNEHAGCSLRSTLLSTAPSMLPWLSQCVAIAIEEIESSSEMYLFEVDSNTRTLNRIVRDDFLVKTMACRVRIK